MSGRISISLVDIAAVSFDFVRVRCVSISLFLVRNCCGPRLTVEISAGVAEGASAIGRDAEVICSS
jgi:hypothetical protein